MGSKRALIFAALLLGVLTPLVPRLLAAATESHGGAHLEWWLSQHLRDPAGFARAWAWLLSPWLGLLVAAATLLRAGVDGPTRRRRGVALWSAAGVAFLLGLNLCAPIPGQGFGFYIGEAIYPIFAVPAMAGVYGVVALVFWITGRTARSCRGSARS